MFRNYQVIRVAGKPRKSKSRVSTPFPVPDNLPPAALALGSVLHCVLGLSRLRAQQMIRQGQFLVNATVVRDVNRRVRVGDTIDRDIGTQEIRGRTAPKQKSVKAAPQHRPALFYRDEHLLVVFKPAGILTVPTPKRERKTLAMWLANELKGEHSREDIRFVQRLDRDVSGIIVVSLSEEAYMPLRKQFEQHLPQRRYVALVAGRVEPQQGTFSSLMATGKKLERFQVESKGFGERAITHYRVMQQEREAASVEVWLETGRRHQIRVHFAEAGHPVLGDDRYKRHSAMHPKWPANRIALHAATLEFDHPVTGESMKFTSSVPREFKTFLEAVGEPKAATGETATGQPKAARDRKVSKTRQPANKRTRKKRYKND